MAEAQGFYLITLLELLGGSYAAYKNMFQEIAAINAQAVHGLQPEINIWNSGGAAGGVADGVK